MSRYPAELYALPRPAARASSQISTWPAVSAGPAPGVDVITGSQGGRADPDGIGGMVRGGLGVRGRWPGALGAGGGAKGSSVRVSGPNASPTQASS